jgi:IclR family mhp operon transcriptional activator
LSCGYRERVRLVEIARKHIVDLTKDIGWPVAIASRVGPVMVVRDTTNELTALTFSDYHQGYPLPIAASASGLVCLAFSNEEQRSEIINLIKRNGFDDKNSNELKILERSYLDGIVEDGYASSILNPHTKDPGKTSSIAVPLYSDGMVVGALALTFFSR